MKIGFDARAVPYRKGIGTYSRNLLQQYAEAGVEVVVFCQDDEKHTIPPAESFTLVSANTSPTAVYSKATFRALVKDSGVDVLHVPSPWAPTPLSVPLVSTMHDVTPFLYPHSVPLPLRLFYRSQLRKTLEESKRVITVSQILFSTLSIYAGVDPAKVRVIHNGVAERFTPQTDPAVLQAVRRRYSLPERFAFWAGDFRQEKNVPFLIQAWSRMHKRLADPPTLVLAGAQKLDYRKVRGEVQKRGLEGEVLFPGFIGAEDLPAVYSAATIFVFPSLAEGFGLPPLEAMACGTPCVVSNSSSLPEVTGSAALLFDPTSLDAFEDCVSRVLSQPDLYEHLRTEGLRRAARFSWHRSAEETLEVYHSALAG
ncbi:MAG: glycosyltransferase family 4 protein [Thermoleophilia bacterium]|nr:glycosyltransferase family 4 protein [Thermoleophilia bacterium]